MIDVDTMGAHSSALESGAVMIVEQHFHGQRCAVGIVACEGDDVR